MDNDNLVFVAFMWIGTIVLSILAGLFAWDWIEPEIFFGAIIFLIAWGILTKLSHFIMFGVIMLLFDKKLFISMLFVIFAFSNSKAQGYISMIDTSLTWENSFGYYKGGKQVSPWLYYKFSTEDTIFKNDTFRKLMAFTAVDTFFFGGLKEDSVTKKSYGFFEGDTNVFLMYDFSLSQHSPFVYGHPYIIEHVDTILLSNTVHKKFQLRSNWSGYYLNRTAFQSQPTEPSNYCACDTFEWFNGLGSSNGILIPSFFLVSSGTGNQAFYWLPNFEDNFWKFCLSSIKRNNKTIIVFNNNFKNLSASVKDFEKDIFKISYDYINRYVIISNNSTSPLQNFDIKFYDIEGTEVKTNFDSNLSSESNYHIPFSEFPNSGIYICKITTFQSIHIKKLIIK